MIQKRTEPAFIEPMQCKPVGALPVGKKWSFEIKFDAIVASQRSAERRSHFSAPREGARSTGAFPNLVDILASCPLIAGANWPQREGQIGERAP